MTARRQLLIALLVVIPVGMGACSSDDPAGEASTGDGGSQSGSGGASSSSSAGSSGNVSSSGSSGAGSSSGSSGTGSSSSSSGTGSSSSSGDPSDASVDSDAQTDAQSDAQSDASGGVCGAVEKCDGLLDDNCDGVVDEGCGRCPLLTIACPAGCCAVDRWEVGQLKSGYGSSIAVDSSGNVFFAYTRPNPGTWNTSMAIYDALPGTWRTVELGGGTYRNVVLLDAQESVHVLYGNVTGTYKLLYRRSDDHGVTFTEPQTVGTLAIGATFDMALDSQGKPHVAFGNSKQPGSSFPGLTYTSLVNGTWQSEALDLGTTSPNEIDLALGFADRPTMIVTAYHPDGANTTHKRAVFHNGNRWVYENFDQLGGSQSYGSGYFTGHSLQLQADSSIDVLFTRLDQAVPTLYLAHRAAGDAGVWSTTPVAGVSNFMQPTLFRDAQGRRAAVSDGVSLQRELLPGTWTTSSAGVPGDTVAQARRGRYLYLGYSDSSNANRPTVSVVDLGVP